MKKIVLFVVLMVVFSAACGGGEEPRKRAVGHNDADVTFATGMIPHHEQAIEMSRLASQRGESQEVKNLAERIEKAQGPETTG